MIAKHHLCHVCGLPFYTVEEKEEHEIGVHNYVQPNQNQSIEIVLDDDVNEHDALNRAFIEEEECPQCHRNCECPANPRENH